MITEKLLNSLKSQFLLDDEGFHVFRHWLRVLENGRLLPPLTGANLKVVELFSVFHDSQRENEGFDPDHGSEVQISPLRCVGAGLRSRITK